MAISISKKDYYYFKVLYGSFDQTNRQKFLEALRNIGNKKAGTEISKIQIIDDTMLDQSAISPNKMITRGMIRIAYKTIKEESNKK